MTHAADLAQAVETMGGLVASATARLGTAVIATARLDAEVLLAEACGVDRTHLYAGWRRTVPSVCRARFDALLTRRLAREPVQYLVGRQEFGSLDFAVSPAVLIPRPETELLIELTLRDWQAGRGPLFAKEGTGEVRNEETIGEVIKGRPRDSYYLTTKISLPQNRTTGLYQEGATTEEFLKRLDISLKRLGVDYVDILHQHGVSRKESVMYEPI